MKGKALIPLIVGLIVGVFAIKLTFDVVDRARGNTAQTGDAQVVRTRVDIPMAAEITDAMVEIVKVPKVFVPSGALTTKEEVIGRVTNGIVPKSLPVLTTMLAPKGTKAGLESQVPPGYRAVAVKIDESSGVGYLVKPGSRVDVVAVMTIRTDRGQETRSNTILQNVEVAAVGQELGENADKGAQASKSVTLIVKPADVPVLHLASQKGKILLAMRNTSDAGSSKIAEATEGGLLHGIPGASRKQGLFSKWFGGGTAGASSQTNKTALPRPVLARKGEKPAVGWQVEVYRGSLSKATKFDVVRFNNPGAHTRGSESMQSFTSDGTDDEPASQ